MQEKKQKKIKASTEAGEVVRVHEILRYVPSKLRRRPQPPCLDARKESKEDQGVRDAGQFGLVRDVYSICFLFFVFTLFLVIVFFLVVDCNVFGKFVFGRWFDCLRGGFGTGRWRGGLGLFGWCYIDCRRATRTNRDCAYFVHKR